MARKAFYSFHYVPDNWRASTVRNIGVIDGNQTVSDNEWETITSGGNKAIENWIASEMKGKSCVVVLVGSGTAGRKWINHEITNGWNGGKGVVGIHIHNILDRNNKQSYMGSNPFTGLTLDDGRVLSSVIKCYNPPYTASKDAYNHIAANIESWVEEAIEIRNRN